MEKIPLVKREYLEDGYGHVFKNISTGEQKIRLCTKEEYESLGGENGHLLNPNKEGEWEYVLSCGGFPLLNTEGGQGKEFDFFVKDQKYFVYEYDKTYQQLAIIEYLEDDFNKKYIWQ